ncbi:MAG: heavy-metal-associated domain-containing protein [Clostridia bacterium]|nr:heavy-metal-associated domain-containing protein [Clostridia bacterium]
MIELILNVSGMMCEGCENRVKNAVGEIAGVKDVLADHNTGKVIIKMEDNTSVDEIKETIEDIGYEVKED